ncbi:MAG TPA: GxxExxY protein [Longimicrobiales bacterium]
MKKLDIQDSLTQQIIGCIIKVHRTLGPGFVESVYRRALVVELNQCALAVETEKLLYIHYEKVLVGRHRLDLVVANEVVIEIKAVRALHEVHYAQLRSYLKAARLRTGILVNFSTERADYRRLSAVVHD